MANCKEHSDCSSRQVCSDGKCVSTEDTKPREVRRTFVTSAAEYGGKLKAETKKVQEFGEFLNDQMTEAAKEREEQEEDIGLWGTIGSIVGFGIGCIAASVPTGGMGCVTGGTIGAGIGSTVGRGGADYLNKAEDYGLTEDEFNQLDSDELLFTGGIYDKLVKDAKVMQEDLDDFDDNDWKRHMMGVLGDTWNAYKMGSFAEGIIGKGAELLAKETGEKVIGTTFGQGIEKTAQEFTDIASTPVEGNLLSQVSAASENIFNIPDFKDVKPMSQQRMQEIISKGSF